MKFTIFTTALNLGLLSTALFVPSTSQEVEDGSGNMVKMCLFYDSPSGHARSDPIISTTDLSDHVHTFYGPLNFHPDTSHADLRNTGNGSTSSPWVENQSLYWHPSIYEKTRGTSPPTYTRVNRLKTSPYYRWDNSVKDVNGETTQAFPDNFRMIAYSNEPNANKGGETGGNIFTECCNENEEDCSVISGRLEFPKTNCSFLGLAFAMPNCFDGRADSEDHRAHVAYTLNGEVAGPCPSTHPKRLPQVQLFLRIPQYRGAEVDYVLADESSVFHVDFMNGWQKQNGVSVLQNIINNCPIEAQGDASYNPPCTCTSFLTANTARTGAMCDSDVRSLIADEATDIVSKLPRKSNSNTPVITKTWTNDPTLTCTPTVPDFENPDQDNPDEDEEEEPCENCEEEPEDEEEEPCEDCEEPEDGPDEDEEEPCENCEEEPEDEEEEPCEDCEEPEDGPDEEEEDPCEDCEEPEDGPEDEEDVPENTSCLDSDRKFLFNGQNKHCKWVGKNWSSRCSNTADDGQSISSLCPLACKSITGCTPSDNSSTFLHPKSGREKTCAWANSAKKCKRFWVIANCPASCAPYV